MNDNISWVFELTLKNGKLDELKNVMTEISENTYKEEPQTLNYEWSISEDEKKCHIYERYANSDAAILHLQKFINQNASKVMALGDATYFVVYGNPSTQCKEILDKLGATYMKPIGGFTR